MKKMLIVNADLCIGCRMCEAVCPLVHYGAIGISHARLKVLRYDNAAFFNPVVCMQCEVPNCASVCPSGAISKNPETGVVKVSKRKCTGCKMCNPKFWIIFEKAEKLGVPIYLHPKQPSPDMIKPYLTYPALANAMWGFAAEASLHAVRLICSGVFDRYPDVKVILGHLGEAIPFWLWRLDNHWEKEGKRSLPAKKKPSDYFKNNFFVTTSGMSWSPALQFVRSVLGIDRILFAADYPFESMKEAVRFMDNAPISDSEREKIYHLNTEKLLALSP